jgi:MoaA/NifB/PqqE/SkfB family radical SAM enzyme
MPLTPDVADQLVESRVSLVVIGVDAFTASTYGQIRVGGERDTLYRNVENLLRARDARNPGLEVQVQFIEMPLNTDELQEFSEHWLQRGATVKRRNMLSWGGQLTTPLAVPREQRIPCPWAITMMHVFWDGRVPRCPGDTEGEESVGNAWDEALTVLWRRLGRYRQLHLERQFDALPARCQTCKDWMVGVAERVRPRAAGSVGESPALA